MTKRVRRGVLHRVYPGVYRVGHCAWDRETQYLAAVLACGDGAVLSGRAAAVLHGLLSEDATPEVTATKDRQLRGVITHRVRRLDRRDWKRVRGIRVTTLARTIIDLAGRLSFDDLAHLCHRAQMKYGLKSKPVLAALERRPRTKGAAKVRLVFEGDTQILLSRMERLFVRLLKTAGLPLPTTNIRKDSFFVDCRWPEQKLTIELDSYRYHHSRHAWENDYRREREARRRGEEFRRFTWGALTEEAEEVIAEVAVLLGR